MKTKLRLMMTMLLLAVMGSVWGAEVTTTYTFTSREWAATCNGEEANWNRGERAGGYTEGQGIQFTTSSSGANATSPVPFRNVKKIVITYCTNNKTGKGTIKLTVGAGAEQTFSVSAPSSGGTTLKTVGFDYNPNETGTVALTVDCTQNSIYIYSIAITEESSESSFSVSFDCNGGEVGCPNDLSDVTAGSKITLPNAPTKANYTFSGWNDGTSTYQAGEEYTVNKNVTFTAQWTESATSNEEWVLTSLADLTADDIFVIVGNNGKNYAMTNDNGTTTPPVAHEVIVSGNKLVINVPENLKWNVSKDASGYTFYPNGSSSTWLYCTNTNKGVWVGTGNAKHFTLSNEGYLTTTETTEQRYLGIYSSQDWRCYNSINANIKDQSFAFYKRVAVDAPSHNVTFSANGETFSTTAAREGSVIEFPTTIPSDEGEFKFIGWSTADWTGEVDNRPATLATSVTMGTEDMTIYAVYAIGEVTGSRWKKVDENAVVEDGTYAILACPNDSPTEFYGFTETINSSGHGMMTSEFVSFDSDDYTNSMPHGTCELTFVKNDDGFVIYNEGKGYLYAKAASSGNLAWSTTQPEGYWSYATGDLQFSNGAYLRAYNLTIRTYANKINQNIFLAQKVDKVRYSHYCTLVGVYEIVEFATDGYKSYVTENAIDWGKTLERNSDNVDVHAYQVTALSKTAVTLEELGDGVVTSAETPVIVKGKKGMNLLVIASEDGSDISGTNLLKKGSERSESEKDFMYVLQKSKQWSEAKPYEQYNFYPLNPARWNEIGDRQAYLVLATSPGSDGAGSGPSVDPKPIGMRFIHATGEDPLVSEDAGLVDGINDIQQNASLDGEYYSVSGVRVAAPTKGLYIVNGKKVLVK